MKKRFGKIILRTAVAVLFGFLVEKTSAAPVDQYHSSWHLVRETASEDGETFADVYDLTGVDQTIAGNFASKNTSTVINGGPFRIPSVNAGDGAHEGYSAGTKWMFVFSGENFNDVDDVFSFNMVGWSKTNGMLQNIAEGDCVLGTQAVVVYPDTGNAIGRTSGVLTGITYDHTDRPSEKVFLRSTAGDFVDAIAGMLAYVTGTNITDGYYEITAVSPAADPNLTINVTASGDTTDATVQFNPAFWVDTISLDQTTKWTSFIDGATSSTGNKGILEVINSGDNEVAAIVVNLTGIEWIQFVIYGADAATNEEAGNITVYGRRYN